MTFTTRTVDSNGVGLATRDYGGSGPALVLMHGAGMEQGSLELLAAELHGAFRVITFDFRGHGGTDLAPWTFASAAQDLEAVIAALDLGEPAVGGHSLGGMVAVLYGAGHPGCPGVVNIDGHGRGRLDQYVGCSASEVRQAWATQERRFDQITRGARAVALKALLLALRQEHVAVETARQTKQEAAAIDLFELYEQISCPLLVFNAVSPRVSRISRVLAGSGPNLVGAFRQGLERDLAALAAANERTEVVTVDATHVLHRSHPELVAQHVTAFLQSTAAL